MSHQPRRTLRVMVLCAAIGEGHLTVARELVTQLRARPDVEAVDFHTDLSILGERFGRFMTSSFELHLEQIGWTYELAYRVFYELAPARRLGRLALTALSARALRRAIGAFGADVVVTEYPVLSAALGELRAMGRMPVPVCSSISDPAGLHYWAHPGIDAHLLQWPEAVTEVDRIAGPGRAFPVKPLVDARFLTPVSQAQARATLNLSQAGAIAVVSGGGWGIGDIVGAAEEAMTHVGPDGRVLCLAGRNERLLDELRGRFTGEPRARVLGFTEQMPELLSAADVLVHTTGGTTALEARIVGCPLINYGQGVAHVRAHARALQAQGTAEWAPRRRDLGGALARALAAGHSSPADVTALPDAVDVILSTRRESARPER